MSALFVTVNDVTVWFWRLLTLDAHTHKLSTQVLMHSAHQPKYSTYDPVSTGSGDHVRMGKTTLVCNQLPRPTQPPTLSGMGNEYRLFLLPIKNVTAITDILTCGFMSHLTQNRSFRRRSSQPISWLNTEETKHNTT